MKKKKIYKKQQGIALVSLMLTVAILLSAMISGMWAKVEELQSLKAEKQGKALKVLGIALENYVIQHRKALLTNGTINNVNNIMSPTVNELNTLGLTQTNISDKNLYGGGYITLIKIVPIGCTNTGINANCNLEGVIALTNPMTKNGLAGIFNDSEKLAGIATRKIGLAAGFSDANNPNIIKGYKANWEFENPNGNLAGTFAIKTYYTASSNYLSEYLPRDGSLKMLGNLNMNGNDILQIKDQTNNGIATFNEVLVNGTSTFKNKATFHSNINVNGTTNIRGDLDIDNNLTVAGTSNFTNDAYFSGNLTIKGDLTDTNGVVNLKGISFLKTGFTCYPAGRGYTCTSR